MMNCMRLKKGDIVIDIRGQKGTIITDPDNDPHNVDVDWDGVAGYGTYCIVPGCNFYEPLKMYGLPDHKCPHAEVVYHKGYICKECHVAVLESLT